MHTTSDGALAAAQAAGAAARRVYVAALEEVVRAPVAVPRALECDAYGLCGERQVPEQVASLRSLLAHAGRPHAFTVVSDGSLGPRERDLLRRVDPCVRVVEPADVVPAQLPDAARGLVERDLFGPKLALELGLPGPRPALYADADVLFFPGAADLAQVLAAGEPRFLVDPEPYLDERLLAEDDRTGPPLNAGLLVLPRPLGWDVALARLARLDGEPAFHTEQTLVHLAMRGSGGRPLDPERYVVATDDLPDRGDRHASPRLALRHYTTPVRHKLWLAVAGSAAR